MANMKRNSIELVKAVKEGELDTERYLTPLFISYKLTYEAVDLMEVWRTNPEKKKEKDVFEETADFVARVFVFLNQ